MKRLVLLAVVLVACLLASASAFADGDPLHSVNVYAEGGLGGSDVIASFTKAKCKHGKTKTGRRYFEAEAVSTDGQSILRVSLDEFNGFGQEYEIEKGSPGLSPWVAFLRKGASVIGPDYFSSSYLPPYESVAFGEVLFRDKGNLEGPSSKGELMGVGYGPAMYNYDASKAVTFTGVVECEYGRKKAPKPKKPPKKNGKGGKKGKPGEH